MKRIKDAAEREQVQARVRALALAMMAAAENHVQMSAGRFGDLDEMVAALVSCMAYMLAGLDDATAQKYYCAVGDGLMQGIAEQREIGVVSKVFSQQGGVQ